MSIPYGRQHITDEDIDAVIKVLRSDWLTQGPLVPSFEKAIAAYCGSVHAVAVCNATAALHLACRALNLGSGDWLWTSPNTFVASANCALYCGANVDFVDIDPRTYNISLDALKEKLGLAEQNGTLPKVLVPVHFAGQSCEMAEIKLLGNRYGFRIIEDASHAIGARYLGETVGNCHYSDIVIFSFHPVKIITTGEGGMALTNDPILAQRMELLRSHGITRDPAQMEGSSEGGWYYQQIDLGYNYRITDIQAALGLSQLARLDAYVERRHEIASHYNNELTGLPVVLPWQHPDSYSAFHLYPIRIINGAQNGMREKVFNGLRTAGIGVNVHYIPVHRQPYYRNLGFGIGDFPNAEHYYGEAISIPMYPGLSESDQAKVIGTLRELLA